MNKGMVRTRQNRLYAPCGRARWTPAKTQDLARRAFQSRTPVHRLFRTVGKETPGAPCGRRRWWKERQINWSVPESRSRRRPGRQLRFVGGFNSALRKGFFSDFSQLYRCMVIAFHLSGIQKNAFLAPGASTKGGRDMEFVRSFCRQPTMANTRRCWNTRVLDRGTMDRGCRR